MKNLKQEKIIFISIFAVLILVYIYLFTIIMNYSQSWVDFEKLKTHLWILKDGKTWHWEDIARGLNTKIIEIDPNRISRPLSNIMEVVDTKFRSNLWDHIAPHPSISSLWPFLFVGLPLLLYRLFRNLNCNPIIALSGTCLYLTSAGFITPLVRLSHPAKSLVNFFSILSLVLITQMYRSLKKDTISCKEIPHFWFLLMAWICSCVITFFSDETGLFLYVAMFFIAFPLFIKLKEKWPLVISFILLPIIYFLIIHNLLPWLHFIVNHEDVGLNHYRDYPHASSIFMPNWQNLFTNFYLLFSTHPNLKWNFQPLANHPFVTILQCIYSIVFVSVIGFFIYTQSKVKRISPRLIQILTGLTILIIYVYFHTFQLSHNVKVWNIFWYGCPFSLIYYITIGLILQFIWEEYKGHLIKFFLPLVIFIFALHGLVTSTYISNIFQKQHMNPSKYPHTAVLSGAINIYDYFDLSKSLQLSKCKRFYTILYWNRVKQKKLMIQNEAELIKECTPILNSDPYFTVQTMYATIEAAFEFPLGHSYLNNPAFVAAVVKQAGEPD